MAISREVEQVAGAGVSVLVVALGLMEFDDLAGALAQHQPLRCRDLFGGDALRRQLGRGWVGGRRTRRNPAGRSGAPDPRPGEGPRVRPPRRRTAEEAIGRLADRPGASARVTFHLALDDALLQRQAGSIKPILERLGLKEDEAISNQMVTRAIARLQSRPR
jgi:hypothetical protein